MIKRTPFNQGIWDGTCGIYAAINAIHYLNGIESEDDGNNLLAEVVNFYGNDYSSIVKDGIEEIPAENIINHLKKCEKVKHLVGNLTVIKPYFSLDVASNFLKIQKDLGPNLIAYVGITDYIEGGHWTLIKSVSGFYTKKAYFFDSVGMRSRNIDEIFMTTVDNPKASGKYTFINPKEIFYIMRTD